MSSTGKKGGFAKGFLLPKAKSPRQVSSPQGGAGDPSPTPVKDPHKRPPESEAMTSRQDETAEPGPTRDGEKSAGSEALPEEISPEKRAKVEGESEGMEVERSAEGDAMPMETSTSQSGSTSAGPEKAGFGTRRKPVVIIVIGMAGVSLPLRIRDAQLAEPSI